MQYKQKSPLFLLQGASDVSVTMLKGKQWGEESTKRIFAYAKWTFYPDGTFLFTPSSLADVRNDLSPISGTYTQSASLIECRGEKISELGTSATLDGTIIVQGDHYCLDGVYAVASHTQKIVRVSQELFLPSQIVSSPPEATIAGVQVPSIFRIMLVGMVDGRPFGPLAGTLSLLPRYDGDPNPFLVQLTVDTTRVAGALFWESFTRHDAGEGVLNSEIILYTPEQLRLQCRNNANFVIPSWFTLVQVKYVGDQLLGAAATDGDLSLSIDGDEVSGEISASGYSDLQELSSYKAQLTGKKQRQ